uniref:type IX secretion system plug protein n=1 Tax=uncultured Draconibacterium sp. TaxID=1573823 RepID=UPI003217E490
MKRKLLALSVFLITVIFTYAQEQNFYYENAVYNENIKTVLAYRDGFVLSNPIVGLGEDINLIFTFDDLSANVKDYYYTIVHCDADWNESFISQEEYLDGFTDNPVDDYAMSFNTTFDYVNYRITLPNSNVKFKVSGNYALVVYEGSDKTNRVLIQRFQVYEDTVRIEGTVRRATADAFKGENHQVEFKVYHPNLSILNPRDEVKVVIMQNYRWDNAVRGLKPLYVRNQELDYNYSREIVFKAGNEFRYFDNRTNRMNGENVLATDFHRPYFHKTLKTDEIRSNKKFFSYKEMNGKYSIESQDQEVRDAETECDYTFVHFTLQMDAPLLGGTVNVFGALSNWNANKSNEMTYNFNTASYELTMLLKQGYYNFQYVYVPEGSTVADLANLEGSFWETENDYQIFVYYRDLAGRFDRLVGYRLLNSVVNRSNL